MTSPPSYAIILTHNRPELLVRCVRAAAAQTSLVLVVDNASQPPVDHDQLWQAVTDQLPPDMHDRLGRLLVITVEDQPPNLSKLWRIALRVVRGLVLGHYADDGESVAEWNVALLCDDAILPDGWVATVGRGMREHKAAAASTHQSSSAGAPILKTTPDTDLLNRMCPWAFMLAGEKDLQADERLHWWWCDTHLDWLARQNGGMVILPGPVVVNERPNDFTVNRPELAARAGVDGEVFAQIWGWRPW